MKINVGIVGYGNLGKELERNILKNESFNLVKIFSNRTLNNCEQICNIQNYKNKIDLLFLCCGSKDKLESTATKCIKNFSIIDCYDNHNRLKKYISKINKLAKDNNKIALCCFGWDPGIFSLMRGLFDGLGFNPYTFWGKGLSQGHTQAIKNIDGVVDGLQFTVPNKKIINQIKQGKNFVQNKSFHTRHCYIVCDKKDRENIMQKIITMPDYFAGYKTKINFVSQCKLDTLKNFSHKGLITTCDSAFEFSLTTKSNPELTAKIMIAFARSYIKLKQKKMYGAFTIFDLPFNNILTKTKNEYL